MAASFDERNLPSYRETTATRRAGRAQRRPPSTGMRVDAHGRAGLPIREIARDVASVNECSA
ncbi:hypothetical protein DM992_32950 [Burkholderia sp. JP2-270]|nr:hypothetical protein DM992_32950 [Burkholderia sp. JP2-270]